ncbi:MAG: D-alanyl-D-alanine carboxypeptidase/D-alanyl-D-alanine-endopeptidase [Paludibacter sp.]|nr:D-alanyl-D-alanine carboxypeptidase/D-alanyl-D-alanine-endopeptidase [Paludibacter sp.]
MKINQLVFTLLIIISPSVFAVDPIETFVNNPLLENANISLLVKDVNTGEVLYQFRPNNSATPASTMKVVTTATALELLGSDFRFETKLETDGVIGADSTLTGNLYIHGGGDPTLGSEKLGEKDFFPKWIQALKDAGIKRITGRIIGDESIFETQVMNPKWTWEDMGNYYAPGIHGISYLDNTYKMVFRSGKIGTTPEILRVEPEIPGLGMDNHLKSTSVSYDNAYFYGAPYSNERSVYGEIPANRAEFTVKGDIPNPALLLAQHLTQNLRDDGFTVGSFPLVQLLPTSDERKIIYTHYSQALREIVTETNIKSNNHFAEYIFKYLSTKDDKIGSTKESIAAIRSYWKSNGLPVDQLFQFDGCGLSPCDAVSANFFVELLTYMKTKSKYADDFYNSLPVTGGRGTLSTLLVNTALQGKVHAKSGTIESVKCYAGYIELKNRTLVFALMVNNPNGTSHAVVSKMEDFLLKVAGYAKQK